MKKKADYSIDTFGAERLMAFDLCIETAKLYSPSLFEAFGFPSCREIRDWLMTQRGTRHPFEPHLRRADKNLPALVAASAMRKRGHGEHGPGSVARQGPGECSPDCVVMGNVDPITVQEGTPERVRALCQGVASTRARTIPAASPS